MRKTGITAMALWLVVILSGMAFAAVDLGGSVAMDLYYYKQDKAGFGGGRVSGSGTPTTGGFAGINDQWQTVEEDRSATFLDFSKTSTIWLRWTNEGGSGLFILPVLAGDANQPSGTAALNVAFVMAFGWWRITPEFTLSIGKGTPDVFSPLDPETQMGYDAVGKVTGLGYGNINAKYQNGIKLKYTLGRHVTLNLGLYESRLTDPNNASYTSVGPYLNFKKSSPQAVVDNVSKLPKMEISAPLTFGKTKIIPSAMYLLQTFDNIADGADDTITSYGVSLAGETEWRIVIVRGEVNYGQNWLNASKINVATSIPFKSEYVPALAFAQSAMADAGGKIHNSENFAFWLQGGLKLGRFKPSLIYGYQSTRRDTPTREADIHTQMYGLVCPITITANLSVTPEIMVYDNGNGNRFFHLYRAGATGYPLSDVYDCGKEILAGAQIRWKF